MPLEKATLTRLKEARNSTRENPRYEEDGAPIAVQFNPASLRLTLSNNVEGGTSRGRQARQFNGKASTELSFELHFDTADEAPSGGRLARSVRERTAQVEQFVLPVPNPRHPRRNLAPPRVRFHWGDLTIDGIISALQVEFDLFAEDGTPLRAKMGVTIKEQDARYELLQSTQGEDAGAAPPPGGSSRGAGPGEAGGGDDDFTDRTEEALEGESAAEFAARVGLDPAAWRGLAAKLDGTLSLQAGLAIDFDSSLSVRQGLGVSLGVEAGVSASLEARVGLAADRNAGLTNPGMALSAAGGVAAALQTVASAKANDAAQAERRAFATPTPAAATLTGAGTVATLSAARPRASAAPVRSAPRATTTLPPGPDLRGSTWGFGVPLRPRRTPTAVAGKDPTRAPWERLPEATRPSPTARTAARRRCGCAGGCGCGCGGRA